MITEVFSKLGMGPLEEPNPRPGPGTLQVGQMGQAHNWCPILLWLMPPPCFAGADRQTRGPRCFCSSCNRCSKAEQELQQLVLSALPEHVATLGPEFWDAAWRDLAELVERGSLPGVAPPGPRALPEGTTTPLMCTKEPRQSRSVSVPMDTCILACPTRSAKPRPAACTPFCSVVRAPLCRTMGIPLWGNRAASLGRICRQQSLPRQRMKVARQPAEQ